MKVLVTGVEGYIGSRLGALLLERGHNVVGLDTGYYRNERLYNFGAQQFPAIINKDIRRITAEDVRGFDAVVHLAELSNDPLGQFSPDVTYRINHLGTVRLASLAKEVGVERFVYTSSCSVYGFGSDKPVNEESEPNPQTAYAKCKTLVERDVKLLSDDNFSPTFLRNATAYGASPHMRFDIVLNNLAGLAWTRKEIKMTSDGTPWRPLVHVLDICEAISCALTAPRQIIHKQVFNVGENKANYRVREIAEIVAGVFPGCKLTFGEDGGDNRSYRVSFDKIHSLLPGFKCHMNAEKGATELFELFKRIDLTREVFESRAFTRLNQLKYLFTSQQIDNEFFWR